MEQKDNFTDVIENLPQSQPEVLNDTGANFLESNPPQQVVSNDGEIVNLGFERQDSQ